MKEHAISTRRIYKGRIISLREDVVRLSNGVMSKREIVEHPGAVAVIAITSDRKLVLERQFRMSAKKVLIEIPAGLAHKGENLAKAARRELIEETGYEARKIRKVFAGFSSPGIQHRSHHVLCRDRFEAGRAGPRQGRNDKSRTRPAKKCAEIVLERQDKG